MTNEILETMKAILIPASDQVVVGQFVKIDQIDSNEVMIAGCKSPCNGNCSG